MSFHYPVVTRFAPTPSGELHVGHVLAALRARHMADAHGGRCVLRIEDIDSSRTRDPRWLVGMLEDLSWLGIRFDGEVMVQSRRMQEYAKALAHIRSLGLLYPCFCTRAEVRAEWARMATAPHVDESPHYSGRCLRRPEDQVEELLAQGKPHAWRINMRRVQDLIGCPLWCDLRTGTRRCVPSECDDVVLSRKDTPASYHLAVVVDDAAQQVSLVTRGEDLLACTPLQRALQAVLGLPAPTYAHHPLLRDENGQRLSKRDKARSIRSLREQGYTPQRIFDSLTCALENGGIWKPE